MIQLAVAGKADDFSAAPDMERRPRGARETAFQIAETQNDDKAAMEYDLMKYRLTSQALGIAHWDIDVAGGDPVNPGNKFTWSPELRRMLGFSGDGKDYADTFSNWFDHIHPDDRERVLRGLSAHFADRTGKTRFDLEHQIRTESGEYLYIRTFGTSLRDQDGTPLRIAGAMEDITEARRARDELRHRERTLDILNRAALLLLSRKKRSFESAISDGLGLIAGIAEIDRMSIFRNTEEPDGLRMSQVYRWSKDADSPLEVQEGLKDVPYSLLSSRLELILASGKCIKGPTHLMPEKEMFAQFGCQTILVVPIFDDGKFWGFTFFERLNEKDFTDRETAVLRSASSMLANAVIRNDEAETIRRVNTHSLLMLDTVPMAVTMWDSDGNILDGSQYALDLFGFSSKRDMIERLTSCVPEYQPNGRLSQEVMEELTDKAFRIGRGHLEWLHLTASGEPILLDLTAIRVTNEGNPILLLYARDIREEKKMLAELDKRDEMLADQAHWYKSLLDAVPLPISVTNTDMDLTFTNTAAENVFDIKREELIGRPCSSWNCPACGTDDCSIVKAKQGIMHTFFKHGNASYQVDAEIIRDQAGETLGYLEVMQDITEAENMARRQAEAANEAKSAFVANISHEMRTPLSAVLGLSELMLENGGLNQENELYLDKIYNAGSTLLNIVNDILDVSKMEAGRFDIIAQEYGIPGLINDAVTQNILRIHSKPVRFTLRIDEDAPARLYGDELRVKQIISNLLSNAFKYTNEGAVELRVSYEREDDSVWTTFRVSDTGIGIRTEDLKYLFVQYTRFDEGFNRKTGGTGLGLSITQKLAELMDGSISVESEYGKGSVFTVKIRQRSAGDAVIGPEMADCLMSFRYATDKRRFGSRLERVQIPYARVLVVDDNITNLEIARGLMRPYGMRIDCVTGGQAAVDAIREEKSRYSAVFMDHMMPGMDGMEAVKIIREEIGTEYARNIPIIALTANAVSGNKERFISKGFNAFISKPINTFRLDEVIRHWIWDEEKDAQAGDRRVFEERRSGRDRRVRDRRSAASPQPSEVKIEGLDWLRGLELFGDKESFLQVLRSYAANTLPLLEKVAQVSQETLPEYAITVHGIKGSSRGICAGAIGSVAESLEHAAKAGDLTFVARNNGEFLMSVRRLIDGIEGLLKPAGGTDGKPRRERPDGAELKRLSAACAAYDIDGIEAAMREIEGYEYTADGGFAEWLRENTARLNYAEVTEKITEMTEGI